MSKTALPYSVDNSKTARVLIQMLERRRPTDFWQVGVGSLHKCPEAAYIKATWPDVRIIGFEPDPRNYKAQLGDNYPGTLVNKACWNHNGTMPFFSRDARPSSGIIPRLGDDKKDFEKIEVNCVMLDTFAETLDPPPRLIVLWADCEGAELEMLRGASHLLEKQQIIAINAEICRLGVFFGGPSPSDVHLFLTGYGFREAARSPGHTDHWDAIYVKT